MSNPAFLFAERERGLVRIVLAERDELPTDSSIRDFKPCYAWRRALVRSRHATWI